MLARHGAAESHGPSDHERELTASGRRDAAAAGRWLRAQGIVPDAALVSDARRTRETWLELSVAGDFECPVDHSAALYAAEVDGALELVHATEDEVGTLVLVGHNPTVALLAQLLEDGGGDAAAVAGMATGFPPAALAVLSLTGAWSALDLGTARLRDFHVGRAD